VSDASEMTVGTGRVVLFHYTLKDDDGKVLDTSDGGDPLVYLHGAGNIVIGLEEGLEGSAVGDKLSVTVPPEKGYGVRSGPGPQPVERGAFPEDAALAVGMQFFAETPDGAPLALWIVGIDADTVMVDANHPLADATLHFDIEVAAIRAATQDEATHGHPHGPDGTAGHAH